MQLFQIKVLFLPSKDGILLNNWVKLLSRLSKIGRYTIVEKDGGISFMGMSAKIVSAKNGIYEVKSSLGNFTVNARKGTVTKNWRLPLLYPFLQKDIGNVI